MGWDVKSGRHDLGDVTLQSGEVLRGAVLRWKSYGTLAPDRGNAILFPTSYSAQASDHSLMIAGYFLPQASWNSRNLSSAASALGAV